LVEMLQKSSSHTLFTSLLSHDLTPPCSINMIDIVFLGTFAQAVIYTCNAFLQSQFTPPLSVIEHMPNKHEALSSIPSSVKWYFLNETHPYHLLQNTTCILLQTFLVFPYLSLSNFFVLVFRGFPFTLLTEEFQAHRAVWHMI
jgi:hypothetical protein